MHQCTNVPILQCRYIPPWKLTAGSPENTPKRKRGKTSTPITNCLGSKCSFSGGVYCNLASDNPLSFSEPSTSYRITSTSSTTPAKSTKSTCQNPKNTKYPTKKELHGKLQIKIHIICFFSCFFHVNVCFFCVFCWQIFAFFRQKPRVSHPSKTPPPKTAKRRH